MHQHTRKLQTVKVLVTTCGLHFDLKQSRCSGKVETRRLVWSVQAFDLTAEFTAGLHAREVADSKASNPRLDLIEIETRLKIVNSSPLLIYDGALSLITSGFETTTLAQHVVSEQAANSLTPQQMWPQQNDDDSLAHA